MPAGALELGATATAPGVRFVYDGDTLFYDPDGSRPQERVPLGTFDLGTSLDIGDFLLA